MPTPPATTEGHVPLDTPTSRQPERSGDLDLITRRASESRSSTVSTVAGTQPVSERRRNSDATVKSAQARGPPSGGRSKSFPYSHAGTPSRESPLDQASASVTSGRSKINERPPRAATVAAVSSPSSDTPQSAPLSLSRSLPASYTASLSSVVDGTMLSHPHQHHPGGSSTSNSALTSRRLASIEEGNVEEPALRTNSDEWRMGDVRQQAGPSDGIMDAEPTGRPSTAEAKHFLR